MESFILDFDGDIYGERVKLAFVQRIRDEKKFVLVKDLIVQMHEDVTACKSLVQRAWVGGQRGSSKQFCLMNLQKTVVDPQSAGIRLDLFLTRCLANVKNAEGFSRSGIQKLIAEGQITLNGKPARASARLKTNDLVAIKTLPPKKSKLVAEPIALNVIYEDDDCIVINKAPGIVVHPAAGRTTGTLVNAILYHCPDLQGIGGESRPGIVHRLDKDTSGVMIIAKSMAAFQQLGAAVQRKAGEEGIRGACFGKTERRARDHRSAHRATPFGSETDVQHSCYG